MAVSRGLLAIMPSRKGTPMIVEIQVLPRPAGSGDDSYRHVEAAIAVVSGAGVNYEVGALGTTFETTPERAWELSQAAHNACLEAGADSVITVLKLAQAAGDRGSTIAGLTGKFRE